MLAQNDHANPPAGAFRVLVVDDYPDTCETTAKLLEFYGIDAHTATSGHEAIRHLTAFVPDLVLLDIAMPNGDGIEVAQAIRRTQVTRKPVIAAVSGYSSKQYQALCAGAGFDYFLHKPLSWGDIDRLVWFERTANQERFTTLKQERAELSHRFIRSQLDYAGVMLDTATATRNEVTKKRCLESAALINERAMSYLSSEASFSPSQLQLRTLLGKLEVRLLAIRAAAESER